MRMGEGEQLTATGYSLQCDVTGEPVPRWEIGVFPQPEE
jgi:hypothetical protein